VSRGRLADDVAEAGYDSAGTSTYFDLMESLSRISRVCTYDRAGTGTSDGRPDGMHVTSLLQAHELHDLLEGAGISPPYVVVAHSYGAFVGRLFAATYLGETSGLVLIDSSHQDEIGRYRRYYGNAPEGVGAPPGDIVWRVLLPQLAPAIGAAAAVVFAGALGEFVIVQALVGTNEPRALGPALLGVRQGPEPRFSAIGAVLAVTGGAAYALLALTFRAAARSRAFTESV
jgi:pimeloyl-ACP methyl ester carboxylesterase